MVFFQERLQDNKQAVSAKSIKCFGHVDTSMMTLYVLHFAENHMRAQTMSKVDLPVRKPLCVWERKPLTREDIRCKGIKDMAFRGAVRRTIRLKLVGGPLGLPGFRRGSGDHD